MLSSIRGRVERVYHTSGAYNVMAFLVMEGNGWKQQKSTRVAGNLFGLSLASGATLELQGEWVTHAQYGRQFKAYKWEPWAVNNLDVVHFLCVCTKVLEKPLLDRVVSYFGLNTFDALTVGDVIKVASNDAERDALDYASSRWNTVCSLTFLSDTLQEYGLGASFVSAVFNHFGFGSVAAIEANPYCLLEVDGVPFNKVDAVAIKKGVGVGDFRRIAGAVLWLVRDQIRQHGHLFVRRGDIFFLLNDLSLRNSVPSFDVANLPELIEKSLVAMEQQGLVKIDPNAGIYTPETYLYERDAATMLSKFLTPLELVVDLASFLKNYENANDITLSTLQKEAVTQLLAHRVLVVTGAPGTGKTTLVRTFVQLFRQLGITYMLMAPTGIAAKRLTSVTGAEAQTIHRALKYDGVLWGIDSSEPLETQAVMVDEVSMLDMEVFYRLLSALTPDTMLILVGDDAQLPSVGPGNVLRELLACKTIPHVCLDQIFRQAETSDIVLAAHNVRRGLSPLNLPPKKDPEFRFVQVFDENTIADMIVQMAEKLKSRDANFQILSPKYEGIVGVDNLNNLLRNQLNPDKGQASWQAGDFNVRIGDRLMVIKNNYKLNVYNGDLGKLIAINRDSLVLRIHGIGGSPDMVVNIPKDLAFQMLKLAYAVTVHRCQGEEFETVIIPLVKCQGRMLQRNLFYTAITRARKKVWVLGDIDAVLKAVANDKVIQRNTILRDII